MKNLTFKNRRVSYDYFLMETLECGIVLFGTEVKSLRSGKCTLDGSWVKIEDNKLVLVGCSIPEYQNRGYVNHEPKRDRQLLVHKREVVKFALKGVQKGFTIVPTKLYFNERGKVKVEVAIARGKQVFDKRESIKEAESKRQMNRR